MNIFRRLLRRLIPTAVVAIALAVVVGLVKFVPARQRQAPQIEPPPVNVKVEQIRLLPEMADVYSLPGAVQPNRVVNVAAEVSARIEKIVVSEGQQVQAGEPLIYLNTDLLKAEVDRTAAQTEFDRRELDRYLRLKERGVTTETELDQTRARAAASQAAHEEAASKLARATIVAPNAGVLNSLPVEMGEYVQPGDKVAQIVDIDTVKVAVDVPERDVHYLRLGQKEDILVDSLDDVKVVGIVTYINEMADETTRTTRVEISAGNPDRRLRSGQIVRVRMVRQTLRDVIMIPLQAVIPLEQGSVVYVVNGLHATRRPVTLGLIRGSKVRVLEGLSAGDSLIVSGHQYVGPGQKVTVVE